MANHFLHSKSFMNWIYVGLKKKYRSDCIYDKNKIFVSVLNVFIGQVISSCKLFVGGSVFDELEGRNQPFNSLERLVHLEMHLEMSGCWYFWKD